MVPPRTAGIALAAAAVLLPLLLPGPYHRHVLVLAGIFTLMALGFDLVLGYLGELSLGHAAFFGIGAYTTALLARNTGVPFPLDLLLAALVTGAQDSCGVRANLADNFLQKQLKQRAALSRGSLRKGMRVSRNA